ncbi:MAG TPA: hypothetical protein V6C97_25755 [Oculatellaceae cyanobacterium]
MKFQNIGIAFSASLLALGLSSSIAFGADGVPGAQFSGAADPGVAAPGAAIPGVTGNPTTPNTGAGVSADTPPELQSAKQRVELSRAKLDQAKQQLSAAKAMLKAADAEYKAAKADHEALSLRTQARKLADASGLQDTISTGTRLYPANVGPAANVQQSVAPVPNYGAPVAPGAPLPDATETVTGQTAMPPSGLGTSAPTLP